MPNGDGTGPNWAKGAGWGCGRRLNFGSRTSGICIRTISPDERKKLLLQRKADIEAEIKAIEDKK